MSMIELAGCILTNPDDKVLLIHRHTPEMEQWEIPGGKVEPGEVPDMAAVRETEEELGVSVVTAGFLGETTFQQLGEEWHYSWFKADIIGGERPEVQELAVHDRYEYVDLRRLFIRKYYQLSPGALAFMKLLQDGEIQL